ncbi:MAG TPA: LysR family transcriptional regulator [Steroidobacteraceae bacterium]|nr:LysR family transcriptional regulator [Steroidobacteraceae bacterium]
MSSAARKPIRYRAITYFDAVRRYGSIREAARKLGVAASAINRQLIQFETDLGMPLFERFATGMKLTAAGEVFAHHALTVLQDARRATDELEALRGLRRGELSVVTVESLGAAVLPDLLAAMASRYPGIRLTVKSAGSNQIAGIVASGTADVGLAFSLGHHPELQQLGSGQFRLGAIMRPEHPLAREKHVTFPQCAMHPVILPTEELSIHTVLLPHLTRFAGKMQVLAEVGSLELMKNLTLKLPAISFQTQLGIEAELKSRRLIHVPLQSSGPVTTDLGIYVRRGRTFQAALDAFVSLVRDQLTELEKGQ